jgi:hypothetical protein
MQTMETRRSLKHDFWQPCGNLQSAKIRAVLRVISTNPWPGQTEVRFPRSSPV